MRALAMALALGAATTAVAGEKSAPLLPGTLSAAPHEIRRVTEARERPVQRVEVVITIWGGQQRDYPEPDLPTRINEVLW